MSNLVEDDFQDVIGTLLVNHTPLTDTFGAGWVNANANILDIIDDPDLGGSETLAKVRASAQDGGGIIRSGIDDDFQVTGTVQFWGYSTSGNAYIGCRATQIGGLIDSYGMIIYPPGNIVELKRVVNGVGVILASVSNSSGFFGYNDMEVSAVGTTIEGAVTNLGITLGPVTDAGIVSGQYAFISGHDRDPGGNRWRAMSAHSTVTMVTVSDSANGADFNVPLQLAVVQNDSSLETDAVGLPDIQVPVPDTGAGTDSTTLNLDQVGITDTANGSEAVGISNAVGVVIDIASAVDVSADNVFFTLQESGSHSDSTTPAIAQVPVPDPVGGLDVVTGVVIDALLILESGLYVDLPFIQVLPPTVMETGGGLDSISSIALAVINEAANTLESNGVTIAGIALADVAGGADSVVGFISLSTADQSNATVDVVLDALAGVPVADQLAGSTVVAVLISTIVQSDVGQFDDTQTDVLALVPLSDSGAALDVVAPPFVGHFATDQGQGLALPTVFAYAATQDGQTGLAEVPDIAAMVSVNDAGVGLVQTFTITTFGVAVFDTGGVDDDIANVFTTQYIPVSDAGLATESIANGASQIPVEDSGSVNDPLFVYDDNQKIVNIIFSLSKTRILFSLNTDEEHNP